jgi:hypothetical protein
MRAKDHGFVKQKYLEPIYESVDRRKWSGHFWGVSLCHPYCYHVGVQYTHSSHRRSNDLLFDPKFIVMLDSPNAIVTSQVITIFMGGIETPGHARAHYIPSPAQPECLWIECRAPDMVQGSISREASIFGKPNSQEQ